MHTIKGDEEDRDSPPIELLYHYSTEHIKLGDAVGEVSVSLYVFCPMKCTVTILFVDCFPDRRLFENS